MNIIRLPIVLLFLSCAACADKKAEKSSDADLAKLEYSAESNPVEVIRLEKKTFNKQIVSNGKLSARSKSALSFKSQGVVDKVYAANGTSVRSGDVIATLDMTDARNALNSARQNLEKARIDLSDAIIGFGYDGRDTMAVPAATLATAKVRSGYNTALINLANAENALDNCTLRAPFAGKIANLKGKQHELSSGEFCTVIDDSRIDVDFSIVETELGFVKQGQRVKVSSFVDPQMMVTGTITAVNPTVDNNGQVQIRAQIAGHKDFLDGMNVKVFVENDIPGQLVVPKSAVVIRDNLEVLFRYADGRAMWTYVHTVMDNSTEYVVVPNTTRNAELNEGDLVIVSGNLNLADNSKVELKEN